MPALKRQIDIVGTPPPWGVTAMGNFIQSALARAERENHTLPTNFFLSLCPWGERNAAAQQLGDLTDVFEARYRLVHFTGCGRPFLIAIMTGDDAEQRQRKAMDYLPWSEHFHVELINDRAQLTFVGEVGDVDSVLADDPEESSLKHLLASGRIVDF